VLGGPSLRFSLKILAGFFALLDEMDQRGSIIFIELDPVFDQPSPEVLVCRKGLSGRL
jgi:hypothetical protein